MRVEIQLGLQLVVLAVHVSFFDIVEEVEFVEVWIFVHLVDEVTVPSVLVVLLEPSLDVEHFEVVVSHLFEKRSVLASLVHFLGNLFEVIWVLDFSSSNGIEQLFVSAVRIIVLHELNQIHESVFGRRSVGLLVGVLEDISKMQQSIHHVLSHSEDLQLGLDFFLNLVVFLFLVLFVVSQSIECLSVLSEEFSHDFA